MIPFIVPIVRLARFWRRFWFPLPPLVFVFVLEAETIILFIFQQTFHLSSFIGTARRSVQPLPCCVIMILLSLSLEVLSDFLVLLFDFFSSSKNRMSTFFPWCDRFKNAIASDVLAFFQYSTCNHTSVDWPSNKNRSQKRWREKRKIRIVNTIYVYNTYV